MDNPPMPPTISTAGDSGLGSLTVAHGLTASAISTTGGVANRAVYVPVRLHAQYLCRKLWWLNGGTVSGNIDVGVYTFDGAQLASTGSTAQSGTSAIQSVTLSTPLLLTAGSYYLAMSKSNNTGLIYRMIIGGADEARLYGTLQEDSAFPLPAQATFATAASTPPIVGMANRTLI